MYYLSEIKKFINRKFNVFFWNIKILLISLVKKIKYFAKLEKYI